jgi:hypothetical protein
MARARFPLSDRGRPAWCGWPHLVRQRNSSRMRRRSAQPLAAQLGEEPFAARVRRSQPQGAGPPKKLLGVVTQRIGYGPAMAQRTGRGPETLQVTSCALSFAPTEAPSRLGFSRLESGCSSTQRSELAGSTHRSRIRRHSHRHFRFSTSARRDGLRIPRARRRRRNRVGTLLDLVARQWCVAGGGTIRHA